MFLAKFLSVLLIFCAVAHALPFDDFNSDDDRLNEISAEFDRKPIIPSVDRLFSSAEMQTTIKIGRKASNKIRKNREDTTKSSEHAHGMIKSMLSFFDSVLKFGKTFMRNE